MSHRFSHKKQPDNWLRLTSLMERNFLENFTPHSAQKRVYEKVNRVTQSGDLEERYKRYVLRLLRENYDNFAALREIYTHAVHPSYKAIDRLFIRRFQELASTPVERSFAAFVSGEELEENLDNSHSSVPSDYKRDFLISIFGEESVQKFESFDSDKIL